MTQVSAPKMSGYLKTFNTESEAIDHAAELCNCNVDDLILVESPDGEITYCYGTHEAAEADPDGAYAVQFYKWTPPFRPTHKIVTEAGESIYVCLQDGEGAAYTRDEWDSQTAADYERQVNGDWTFQGEPFAGTVRAL